jgi:hypothetical protein
MIKSRASHTHILYHPPTSQSWNRYFYPHAYSSIILNSHKLEAMQKFIDRWMDKHNVVFIFDGLIFSLEKEGT